MILEHIFRRVKLRSIRTTVLCEHFFKCFVDNDFKIIDGWFSLAHIFNNFRHLHMWFENCRWFDGSWWNALQDRNNKKIELISHWNLQLILFTATFFGGCLMQQYLGSLGCSTKCTLISSEKIKERKLLKEYFWRQVFGFVWQGLFTNDDVIVLIGLLRDRWFTSNCLHSRPNTVTFWITFGAFTFYKGFL